MSDSEQHAASPGAASPSAASNCTIELIVCVGTFVLGALVVADSLRLGTGWSDEEGPKAGYFPFYIGLIICIASIVNAVLAVRARASSGSFVTRAQAADVIRVFVPMLVFAGLIKLLGIYVAAIVYIAFFMRWIGKYSWAKSLAVAVGTAVAFFVVFDLWFKVPLIKGPLEAALGLA